MTSPGWSRAATQPWGWKGETKPCKGDTSLLSNAVEGLQEIVVEIPPILNTHRNPYESIVDAVESLVFVAHLGMRCR